MEFFYDKFKKDRIVRHLKKHVNKNLMLEKKKIKQFIKPFL